MSQRVESWERAKERIINIHLANLGIKRWELSEPDADIHYSPTDKTEVIGEMIEIFEMEKYPKMRLCSIGLYYSYSTSTFMENNIATVEVVRLENSTDKEFFEHKDEVERMAEDLLEKLVRSLRISR